MCFGSNKTTTNNDATTANTASSAPTNPAIAPAVTNEVNAATSLASQPLQQYTGSLVAPLTADQNTAINQIDANSTYTPTPFSASAVDQYESPYTADVLNTTEAAENLQDQQQQQSLAGGITAAGAFGGDRQAVVQSELAGQQDTANNVTNANIENQGYAQALGQFNTTNQLGFQTAQQNLAGASSLLNAGTLEQQVNQENLDIPYEQYLQQQAYPYQQLDFESGILGSAAGTSGTTTNQSGSTTGTNTSSTSTPIGSQLLGLGLSAASFLKTGGRAKMASGGLSDAAYMPLPTPVAISSFIPSSSSSKGSLQSLSAGNTPSAPSGGSGGNSGASASPSGLSQGMSEGNQIGTALESPGLGGYLGTDPTYTGTNAPLAEGLFGNAGGYGGVFGEAPATVSAPGASLSDFSGLVDSSLPDLAGLKKGGRTRLADGGTDDGDGFDALLDSLYQPDQDSVPVASPTSLAQAPAGATAMSLADTPPAWRAQATNYAPDPSQSTSLAGPTPSDVPTGYVPLGPDSPISLGAGPSASASTSPTWDDGTPVVAPDDEGQGPDGAPASLAAAPAVASNTSNPGLGTSYAPKIIQSGYTPKPDWRRALLTAGTSMMAANTGNGLTNVGAGLKAGANEYYDQLDKDNNPTVDHSGPTTLVRYADGTVVDTGLPTEAALNAKASQTYKEATLELGRDRLGQQGVLTLDRINNNRQENGLPPLSALPSAAPASAPNGAPATNGVPLGIRSNNPGNLQPNGKEATYNNPTAGVLAASQNLDAYAAQGINTISGIVSKWAPPTDATGKPINDTPAYIQAVSKTLGVDPSAPLNLKDPNVKGALLEAMFKQENGGASPSAGGIPASNGIDPAFNAPTPMKLSKPELMAISDGKGGTTQVLAQQDSRSGQWVTADQNRTPINSTAMRPISASQAAQAAAADGAKLSDAAIQSIAGQYRAGDHSALTSLGYGSQGATNRAAVWNEISKENAAQGVTPQQQAQRLASFNKSVGYFATGAAGKTITAYNNFLQHSNVLRDLVGAMGNGDVQAINAAKNAFQTQFGVAAPNSFQGVRDIVADEGVKAILGGAGALGDRDGFKATISRAGSPQQLYDMLGQYQKLGAGQLYSQEKNYTHNTGLNDFNTMLTPDADKIYTQYKQSGAGQANAAPPVGAMSKGYRFKGGDPSVPANWQKVGP